MSERELLEKAAKAAGYAIEWESHPAYPSESYARIGGQRWNPLNDDGDALRLAVKLGLQLDLREPETHVFGAPDGRIDEFHHRFGPCTATRRAIVRAAAAIGESHE